MLLLTEIQKVYSLKRDSFLQSVLPLNFFNFWKHRQYLIVSKTEGDPFLRSAEKNSAARPNWSTVYISAKVEIPCWEAMHHCYEVWPHVSEDSAIKGLLNKGRRNSSRDASSTMSNDHLSLALDTWFTFTFIFSEIFMFAKHLEAKKGNRNVLYNQSQCSQDIKTKTIVFYKRDFNFYKKYIY